LGIAASVPAPPSPAAHVPCFHCGTLCRGAVFHSAEKAFCCQGCLTVFELLSENGLTDFYSLSGSAGVRVKASAKTDQFKFLDEPAIRERLVDFSNARLTRVTFQIPVGPMMVGHYQGEQLGACTDCRRLWGDFRAGRLGEAQIEAINERLAPTPGTCMVMGTASTMACVIEAMGLALTQSASIPATHADRLRCAEATGKQAVALAAAQGPCPTALMTPASFRNAMVVLQAIGGSTNALIHLTAAAGRCGIKLDLAEFDRLGREVPVLVDLKPSGDHYMEHFHWAGAMPRLLRELSDLLDLDAPTVSGGTLRDYADGAELVKGQTVIRSRSAPIKPRGSMAVLHGNLAPRGAIIKQSAASPALMTHTGRAVVFESVEDLTHRIDDPELDVTATDVLVLRNAGPVGAPGMPEAGYLPIPRKLATQGVKDMVRISDARMSGTAFGTIVLHIAPESAAGGPLALVRNGDSIELDVPNGRIELRVDAAELDRRRAELIGAPSTGSAPAPLRGYEALFHRSVLQADEGCDFDFLVPGRDPRSMPPDR
jgi:dihydroxy-acid dehydratase